MAINYATKDGGLFDVKLAQSSLTGGLVKQVDFINNTKNFTLNELTVSGYKPHTRNKGFNAGTYSNEKPVYTITQDRDIEFYVDTMDVDETNQDVSIGNITRKFIETQSGPEVDAYRFMKLFQVARTNGKTASASLATNTVYSAIKAGIKVARKHGAQNLLCYVSSDVMDLLERSTEFTRNITNQNVGSTALDSRVTSIDGVTLIEVWDIDRFNTFQNFSDGFTPNGYVLNFVVVAVPYAIAVAKHQAVFMFAPGQHTNGDGYLYQNRLYHDLIVPNAVKDAVYAHYSTDFKGTEVTISSMTQVGGTSGSADSTGIEITFGKAVTGLKAEHITITNDTGAATKGDLTGSGTEWTIALASVETAGKVKVLVSGLDGYKFPATATEVTIYKGT